MLMFDRQTGSLRESVSPNPRFVKRSRKIVQVAWHLHLAVVRVVPHHRQRHVGSGHGDTDFHPRMPKAPVQVFWTGAYGETVNNFRLQFSVGERKLKRRLKTVTFRDFLFPSVFDDKSCKCLRVAGRR